LAVSPIDRAVSISGVGCAHDSPLRVLLVASLLVPGLTRTAGDSRLSRGLVPILRSDLTLRTRRGDLALRGRRCRVLGIAQQLLARRGRLRVSTGLTHTQTALARIDQRVRQLTAALVQARLQQRPTTGRRTSHRDRKSVVSGARAEDAEG